jgi:hypothetical protein
MEEGHCFCDRGAHMLQLLLQCTQTSCQSKTASDDERARQMKDEIDGSNRIFSKAV